LSVAALYSPELSFFTYPNSHPDQQTRTRILVHTYTRHQLSQLK
jgi:hypothetical protein